MILDTSLRDAERTPTIILISSNPTPLINRPPDAIRFRAWNLSRPFRIFLVAYTFVHACRFNHRRVLCACCTYVSTTLLLSLSLPLPSSPFQPFFHRLFLSSLDHDMYMRCTRANLIYIYLINRD